MCAPSIPVRYRPYITSDSPGKSIPLRRLLPIFTALEPTRRENCTLNSQARVVACLRGPVAPACALVSFLLCHPGRHGLDGPFPERFTTVATKSISEIWRTTELPHRTCVPALIRVHAFSEPVEMSVWTGVTSCWWSEGCADARCRPQEKWRRADGIGLIDLSEWSCWK